MACEAPQPRPSTGRRKGKRAAPSHPPPQALAAMEAETAAATAATAVMEAETAATTFFYDTLPGLTLAFSPEEAFDDAAEALQVSGASREDEGDATTTYAVFRNEITAAGDPLKDIPAADFFSLDVSASVEAEPGSPQTPVAASAVAATPSSSRAAEEQPAQGSERAWFRGGRRFRSPMLQLHKEILDFCDFISPSAEEQSSRSAAVQAVSDVEVFGSFRTGLYLPTSDIDVVIFESRVKTPQVIAKARVPIVKFVERKSGIAFDISFDVDGGPQAADFIKDAVKKLPGLKPLCMILKVFLHQRELNEVYTGGIGSYALLTMLITHLQVKSAFSKAYSVLTDANLISSLGSNRSILGTIVRPDSILLDRKGWKTEDMINDMLTEPWEPVTRQFDSENDAVYNWHVIDDEPLPRNSQSASDDTSSSPLPKKKSKSNQKSRKKARDDASGSTNVENGSKEDTVHKRGKGSVQEGERLHHSSGSRKRRKGSRDREYEYDRFTNTLPQRSHVSKW
ncbi:hypothetical protein PR202_ga10180 [Eleusine coracana subsp. coracana]|uniref:Polymerase nucleotidyl transferase domain-containing protein n=1 Tax=Eleusine coracana subsp. coracana TaxID=191504 RepID=A0AAV5C623_ELECO|nr:hypothetical protein PR202_ga10180 [Eleusine coracana subsp. coracana]